MFSTMGGVGGRKEHAGCPQKLGVCTASENSAHRAGP